MVSDIWVSVERIMDYSDLPHAWWQQNVLHPINHDIEDKFWLPSETSPWFSELMNQLNYEEENSHPQ
jgi:hypothetical protein